MSSDIRVLAHEIKFTESLLDLEGLHRLGKPIDNLCISYLSLSWDVQ